MTLNCCPVLSKYCKCTLMLVNHILTLVSENYVRWTNIIIEFLGIKYMWHFRTMLYVKSKAVTILWVVNAVQLWLQSLQIEEQRKWFNGLTSVNNITKITETLIFLKYLSFSCLYIYIYFYSWPLILWSYYYVLNECCFFFRWADVRSIQYFALLL